MGRWWFTAVSASVFLSIVITVVTVVVYLCYFFVFSLSLADNTVSTMMGLISSVKRCMGPNVYPEVPDGGWGWVVAVAFFFVELFTYGVIKSFGIFLQDLMAEFNETNSRVSWVVSICVFIMAFTGEFQLISFADDT